MASPVTDAHTMTTAMHTEAEVAAVSPAQLARHAPSTACAKATSSKTICFVNCTRWLAAHKTETSRCAGDTSRIDAAPSPVSRVLAQQLSVVHHTTNKRDHCTSPNMHTVAYNRPSCSCCSCCTCTEYTSSAGAWRTPTCTLPTLRTTAAASSMPARVHGHAVLHARRHGQPPAAVALHTLHPHLCTPWAAHGLQLLAAMAP